MVRNWLRRHRRAKSSLNARPRLECLEDRSVPATFTVNSTLDNLTAGDGKLTLREAITRANTTPGADTIIVPTGVFKMVLSGPGDELNLTGDFDITDALTIQGAGAGLTIIDGQQLDRVFHIMGTDPDSITVVLQGLTVRNGNVTGDGGGVQVGNADLVLRDSTVAGNRASLTGGGISNGAAPGTGDVRVVRTTMARNVAGTSGGGLSVQNDALIDSVVTVRDSTIRRNVAGSDGGGITAQSANLTNSIVSGNKAGSVTGGDGGGVRAVLATLTGCIVDNNTASDGSGGGVWALSVADLTDTRVTGNSSTGFSGGGIRADVVVLKRSTVAGNSATGFGGGISANTTSLTGSSVDGNFAGGFAGGLSADSASLEDCTIRGNSTGGHAGGIGVNQGVTLRRCTVSGNTAQSFGGGISADEVTLTSCTVSDNAAGGFGGGLGAGIGTLARCTISGNTAVLHGGGLVVSTLAMTNSTISGNTAGTDGGGIVAVAADFLNCTVVGNVAQTGGGLFHALGGSFNLRNTLVALNLVGFTGAGPDVSGDFTSLGHNLIGDGSGSTGFTNGANGDLVGTAVNPIDPMLGPLANNGGRTRTHALLAGSLAIDAGDNAGVPPTDQRGFGFPRVKDGNGDGIAIVDIGACER